ncbi:TPA: FeoB-associated Cys-rich membrane protein [Staphylococcus aureus]|uniref:FeoB-associated Cys-rich membrane protein n=1 Tax=Staphylococcus aureus TaxID=1280 RepID=UPI00263D035B|nr:FeoB-associated Cys-rich membrane protein [Staphylococcus aureus]MDN5188563.1 FeoB-associated Cys-rich membrane protein [Staphylococcus aureus]MDN5191293.1 FeoB-associated Cys-rich membrane protein [Staphylococcus aureus]MDN5193680.1 FeoB-associated Cys-rich membrane protein [Staphylococcus aureus]MDN5196077.1 FeoB-associated Cys-rich membrane protein [Staphylococcus aureus]MDN5199070.1 FeoB-associated Cys-rich membrane protein [Staphylococcus aureus]
MSVIINILIFLAIFGYALYTLVKFFKRSKQGKCGTCEIDRDCYSKEQQVVKHFPGK